MKLLDMFGWKKQEALKTDELRRRTQDEIAMTKSRLDNKFQNLSRLVDDALQELNVPRKPLHPKSKN